jgi:hypothetical protein
MDEQETSDLWSGYQCESSKQQSGSSGLAWRAKSRPDAQKGASLPSFRNPPLRHILPPFRRPVRGDTHRSSPA